MILNVHRSYYGNGELIFTLLLSMVPLKMEYMLKLLKRWPVTGIYCNSMIHLLPTACELNHTYMQFYVSFTRVPSAAWFKVTTTDYRVFKFELFKLHSWRWNQPPDSFMMEKAEDRWVTDLCEEQDMCHTLQEEIDAYLKSHFNTN